MEEGLLPWWGGWVAVWRMGVGGWGGWGGCVCVSGCEEALLEVKAAVESGPVDPEEDGADEREEVGCHRGLVRGRLRLRLMVRLRVGGVRGRIRAWARAGDNDENFCSVRLEPGNRHRSHGRRPRVVGRLAEHIGARQPKVGTEEVDDDRAYVEHKAGIWPANQKMPANLPRLVGAVRGWRPP